MPVVPSQSSGVLRDEALRMLLSERRAAIVSVAAGDASMAPHLYGGDAILAAPLDSAPAPGDLLLYRQQDYWVVHRCLGAVRAQGGGEGYRTRGDGRNDLDPWLARNDVRARVVALRRGGAWRSLEGAGARAYARFMAWHDLFWSAAGIVAGKIGAARAVAAIDRSVLSLLVPLLFPLVHRRIPPPVEPGSAADV